MNVLNASMSSFVNESINAELMTTDANLESSSSILGMCSI